MVSKAQKIRLGIFLTLATLLLIVFFVIVAGKQFLEKRDTYYVKYENTSVNGLQIGSSVKYYGINIGRVDDITFDPEDISKVVVKLSIKDGTPIKQDVTATLVAVGITGLKQIELTGGTNQADLMEPPSIIPPGSSMLDDISGKAEIITEKIESVLNNISAITDQQHRAQLSDILANLNFILVDNRENINSILTNIDTLLITSKSDVEELLSNANLILVENRSEIAATFKNLESVSRKLDKSVDMVQTTITNIDMIVQSKEIKNTLTNFSQFSDTLGALELKEFLEKDIGNLIADIQRLVEIADNSFKHVDATVLQGRRDVLESIKILKETIEYLNEFSRQISDDPSYLIRSKARD